MQEFSDDYRGHSIYPHVSGPIRGPWRATFLACKIGPNSSQRVVLQGAVPGIFESVETANQAAVVEAKLRLDALLSTK